LGLESASFLSMHRPQARRHEQLDRAPQQLAAPVPRQPFSLSVGVHDEAVLVHDQDAVWKPIKNLRLPL
jgi:hypothetical protein